MNCRACGSAALQEVADLGQQKLPDFKPYHNTDDPAYPLKLMLCKACTLLQLEQTTPRDLLYHGRYGFKSGINEAIISDLEDIVLMGLKLRPKAESWLDIACNDGTLLSFVPKRIMRTGVDPLLKYDTFLQDAAGYAEELVCDYFNPDSFFGNPLFDVITSVSMFYDLDDPGKFVRDVRSVLARDGIWIIQMNYALDMLRDYAVDNVGHEHVTYFSVTALRRLLEANGLGIADVTYSPVNGGCFRVVACHRGAMSSSGAADLAMNTEMAAGLGDPPAWIDWFANVRREVTMGQEMLELIQHKGDDCYLYGASTRIGTVLQMMDHKSMPVAAVERNPDKVGKFMCATGIPIISEEEFRAHPPDWLYIGPWFFREVFMEREKEFLAAGGRMIFPLPRLMVTP